MQLLFDFQGLLKIILPPRLGLGGDNARRLRRPFAQETGRDAGGRRALAGPKSDRSADTGHPRFLFVRLKTVKRVGSSNQLTVRSRDRESHCSLAPNLRDKHPTGQELHFGVTPPHTVARLVAVFRQREPDDFEPTIWAELKKNVREKGNGHSR